MLLTLLNQTTRNTDVPSWALTIVVFIVGLQASLQAVAAPKASSYESAVVRVGLVKGEEYLGGGTGFFVSKQGHILTNHHVISPKLKNEVLSLQAWISGTGEKYQANIIWHDQALDLAILKVDNVKVKDTLWLGTKMIEKGSSVYAVGYPGIQDRFAGKQAIDSTVTDGAIAKILNMPWHGQSKALRILSHSANVTPGNSGGPLINECGQVVGINTQINFYVIDKKGSDVDRMQGLSYASHISEVLFKLDALGIKYESSDDSCEAGVARTQKLVLYVNSIAILFVAILTVLMFFRRPRELVVRHTQKTMAVFSGRAGSPDLKGPDVRHEQKKSIALHPLNGESEFIELELEVIQKARKGISFGRSQTVVDKPLNATGLSRRHFRIAWIAECFFMEDLNSTFGTALNGRQLKPYHAESISEGDQIKAGNCLWSVKMKA